jgi:hypothetical protein
MQTLACDMFTPAPYAHPNELDLKRIERGLHKRRRYRYVTPRVLPTDTGYIIESPCCSRNIDADGGPVDVALILFDDAGGGLRLFSKNHAQSRWVFHSRYTRLVELLDTLNADLRREFWQ